MFVELALSIGIYKVWKLFTNREERKYVEKINKFVVEKKILNNIGQKPKIKDIESFSWGAKVTLDIAGICAFEDIVKHEDYLRQLFRAKEIILSNSEGKVFFEIINKPVSEKEYKPIILPPMSLLLGFDSKGEPIIVDMDKTPHIGIQGLSNSGKTKMIELMLKNLKGADFILLNTMKDDFKRIKARRINNKDEIMDLLEKLIKEPYYHQKPTYLILDEANVIGKDKKFNRAIEDILFQARHFNIFLIAIGQSLLKEDCSYKQKFNIKITFKQSKSVIDSFLNIKESNYNLKMREFIVDDGYVRKGKSYKYNF
ncbi:hypothetical protein NNC19_07110 [Clostridium sp. SHJSY1]|uniref:hypothetical protein n=1 Tax=Clostridium sp. SHJSY1 TaxID=2942483 RepID=UPI0028758A9A|nr:hypothetical protein [Clostridium sp. SHJSY1]MDS0525442.1 hypothetical protein [Clostridium sp. SHJSY1]